MRRSDREVTDPAQVLQIVELCDCCTLGINDPQEGVPYLLPINFGYETESDGSIVLYFHGAVQGHKYELIEQNPHVAFEMDCNHQLRSDASRGYCTMGYASVIGRGTIAEVLDHDAKVHALQLIVDHHHRDSHFTFNEAAVGRTRVLALRVERLTCKNYVPRH